jgi:hypothetical protein
MIPTCACRRAAAGAAALALLVWLWAAAPTRAADARLQIVTVPPLAGMKFSLAGRSAVTDARGHADLPVPANDTFVTKFGKRRLHSAVVPKMTDTRHRPGEVARLQRYYGGGRFAALTRLFRVRPRFVDRSGVPVNPALVQSITLKSITGIRYTSKGDKPLVLPGTRVAPFEGELLSKDIQYSIERVVVDGANVVNRAQQRFEPRKLRRLTVRLLFYRAKFISRDAIFGFTIGSGIELRYPSGIVRRHKLGPDGTLLLPALPRGDYSVKVDAPGFSFNRPVSISRRQVVQLEVISYLDIALAVFVLAALALGLVAVRRRNLIGALRRRGRPPEEPRVADRAPPPAAAAPTPASDSELGGGQG